jgi:hypothetical protein
LEHHLRVLARHGVTTPDADLERVDRLPFEVQRFHGTDDKDKMFKTLERSTLNTTSKVM